MKDTKKSAPQLINEQRRNMATCGTEVGINAHFECACRLQSGNFPASCNSRDCRYCFLERERNLALEALTINVNGGNVTININGKEAK